MIIDGTGISAPFEAKISTGWKPKTKLAIKWTKAGENYFAVDRGDPSTIDATNGAAEDIYESEIRIYGKETTGTNHQGINNFLDEIELNRQSGSNEIELSTFADPSEHIFGENIDYSGTLDAAILEVGQREQISLNGWAVKLKLRCLSPSFSSTVPSFPSLSFVNIGYKADSSYTVKRFDTYIGSFSYFDRNVDAGTFTGTFMFTIDEMKKLREYLRRTAGFSGNRAGTISVPSIGGVTYPFGNRRSGGYPYNVNVIDFQDLGLWGLHHYRARLTLAEVI